MNTTTQQYSNTLYIIVAVWPNTKDNHAGMLHLAREIKRTASFPVRIFSIPTYHLRYLFWFYCLVMDLIAMWLRFRVKPGDTVWLMEYLMRTMQQSGAAKILKGKACVIATAHLVPKRLSRHYSDRSLKRRIRPLDRLYVLGTSLCDYFISRGIAPEKVKSTFHYVDTEYYTPGGVAAGERLKVIAMGNMERDFDTLKEIIRQSPEVDFTVCLGMLGTDAFNHFDNVRAVGFVPEDELRRLMQEADVSLNTMYDTIGSNVITTSLACGLPVLASNVGSISDYVTDGQDGMLFESASQAVGMLRRLDKDRVLLREMSERARKKSERISVAEFVNALNSDLIELTRQS